MTKQIRFKPDDAWILEKSYSIRQQPNFGLSSLALFDDDLDRHETLDGEAFQRLLALGYVTELEDRSWIVGNREVDVLIFQLTPLGFNKAEELVEGRRGYSFAERLSLISRGDWIAIVALIVSVIALFQSSK